MEELVEICRHESKEVWSIVGNSRFDASYGEGLAAQLLRNTANDYAEYKNCGVIYRVIRKKDLHKYVKE